MEKGKTDAVLPFKFLSFFPSASFLFVDLVKMPCMWAAGSIYPSGPNAMREAVSNFHAFKSRPGAGTYIHANTHSIRIYECSYEVLVQLKYRSI